MKYWRGNQIDLEPLRPEEGYLYEYWADIPIGSLWRARSEYVHASSLLWQWDSIKGDRLLINDKEVEWKPEGHEGLMFIGLLPYGTYASVDSSRFFHAVFLYGEKYWQTRFTFQDIREFYKAFLPLLKTDDSFPNK